MENNDNRILNEIAAWNQKVDMLKSVFGNHINDSRYLIREKLHHFKEIKAGYKMPENQDEKIAIKILSAEIRRLEKIVFPSRIERFVRKAIEISRGIVERLRGNNPLEQQYEMKTDMVKK